MYIKWSAVHLVVVVVVYPFSDPNHSLLHSFWLFFSFPIYFYKNICTDGGGGGGWRGVNEIALKIWHAEIESEGDDCNGPRLFIISAQ